MGGGSSSSSSDTTTTTNQSDERIAAAENSIVVQLQDGAEVSISDLNTPEVAKLAFEGFNLVLDEALGFTRDELKAERDLVGRSLDLVEKRTQSETLSISEQVLKTGAVVAIATAAIAIAPKIMR